MVENNRHQPGMASVLGRMARTGWGALQNRGQLLAVEWQEERGRQTQLLVMAISFVFLSFLTIGLVTCIIIFLCPEQARLYVAGGFAFLYFLGAVWAGLSVKSVLKQEPFAESLDQLKKDREWLESLE